MKKIAALFNCLVIGAMLTVPVPAAAQKNMDTRFEEIRSEAQRLMDEIKVPGIAIGIMHDGRSKWPASALPMLTILRLSLKTPCFISVP
jgi:hypothetical protein